MFTAALFPGVDYESLDHAEQERSVNFGNQPVGTGASQRGSP